MEMARVQWHTVEQYYDLLRSGAIQTQMGRVVSWIDKHGEGGMTRNQLFKTVFGPLGLVALDGKRPMKWNTMTPAITHAIRQGLLRESTYTIKDEWSDEKNQSKLLFPYWVPEYKIKQSPIEWPPQMEMPLDH
jgi:hypothetical protein